MELNGKVQALLTEWHSSPGNENTFPVAWIDISYDENSQERKFNIDDWGIVSNGICGQPKWFTASMRKKEVKSIKF